MFTGIVQAVGRVESVTTVGKAERVVIDAGALDVGDIAIGHSIAVEGCCLTVVARDDARLSFDVSAETLALTAGLAPLRGVNLEKSLRLADRLGGHLVQGHVDGVGTVTTFAPVSADAGGHWQLGIEVPSTIARYIAGKGSVAVSGVSLTVNGVQDAGGVSRFHVNLIPHTLAVTTLGALSPGMRVNIEVDLLARYAARLAEHDAASRS